MLKNYLKVTLRNFVRNKGYSLINIMGLAMGMAISILILLWVHCELNFDRFHKNSDRIFRVNRLFYNEDGMVSLRLRHAAAPIGPLLKNDFPEIIHSIRTISNSRIVSYGDKHFEERNFRFAEADIFNVLTINMLKGNSGTALREPFTVVITDETAQKYFGTEEPIGKTLRFESNNRMYDLKVTGVFQKLPYNSHFRPDFLASFETLKTIAGEKELQDWSSNNYSTYLLLPEGYNITRLQSGLDAFMDRHLGEGSNKYSKLQLQHITDIHLDSHYEGVYVLSILAFLILLTACLNFMNLATARSACRVKEVGVRKVVGANRIQLIKQFLTESILMSFTALLLSLMLVELALPVFNKLFYSEISFGLIDTAILLLGLFGIFLFVGIVSGSYPAFFLSAFLPVRVLKKFQSKRPKRFSFRAIFVVIQFAISIILIICVGILNQQLEFIKEKKLGFDKENVVVVPAGPNITKQLESFKHELLQYSGVVSVSGTKRVPPDRLADSLGGAKAKIGGQFKTTAFNIPFLIVDYEFIPTLRLEMAAGRNFLKSLATDSNEAFILNETAVRKIGWGSPGEAVGSEFKYGNRRGRVIGVVKDFHFESLRREIAPVVMQMSKSGLEAILIRIKPENLSGTFAFLEKKWKEYHPNLPFRCVFLNEKFDHEYILEKVILKIFYYFAFLAIFIASLGLFGLASFSAEQRTKEIGIRKVLGASIIGIVRFISRDFTRCVLTANIIAWPAAYFVMSWILQGYAYRTTIGIGIFLLAGALVLIISLLTVSYQSIKAASANPINALRYE